MVTIVDYCAGNITSVKRALNYLGVQSEISNNPEVIENAERIIFPGVGHAAAAMEYLNASGIASALRGAMTKKTPIFGICLGTQIVMSHSEEGDTPCLNLIPGNVLRLSPQDKRLKVPRMGWDSLRLACKHYIFKDLKENDEFYFVHSYYPMPENPEHVLARCDYEEIFPVALARDNLVSVQFHPEKSGPPGLKLLENFVSWEVGADA